MMASIAKTSTTTSRRDFNRKTKVCFKFRDQKSCKFGEKCNFSHDLNKKVQKDQKDQKDQNYQIYRCDRGAACCVISRKAKNWETAKADISLVKTCRVKYRNHAEWVKGHTMTFDLLSDCKKNMSCSDERCKGKHYDTCLICDKRTVFVRTTLCSNILGAKDGGKLCFHGHGRCQMECVECGTPKHTLKDLHDRLRAKNHKCKNGHKGFLVYASHPCPECSCVDIHPPGANIQFCLCGHSTVGPQVLHCIHQDEKTGQFCGCTDLIKIGQTNKEFVPEVKKTVTKTTETIEILDIDPDYDYDSEDSEEFEDQSEDQSYTQNDDFENDTVYEQVDETTTTTDVVYWGHPYPHQQQFVQPYEQLYVQPMMTNDYYQNNTCSGCNVFSANMVGSFCDHCLSR